MYRYNHYIARHLVHSTLLIALSLTSIVWLTQALRFINFIVNQGVSIAVFLELTVLLIPSLLLIILPPAFFCAVLFVYYKLKTDSELVVLQAAGLSNWRLARPALLVSVGVMLLTYGISLYLLPVTYRQFREMQLFLRNNYASLFLEEGVFSNPVDGLTVFVRDRDDNNVLRGILVHDNRQANSSVTMMAEAGELVETPKGPRFLLRNGNRQEMREGRLSLLNFQNYTLDISLYAKSMDDRVPDHQELFVGQLLTPDPSLPESYNTRRVAEAHQRLIWPAFTLCLTMLVMAMLLSGEFSRRGHWRRVAITIAMGTALLFTSVGLRGVIAMNNHLVIIGYLVLIVPMLASAWALSDHSGALKRRKAAA